MTGTFAKTIKVTQYGPCNLLIPWRIMLNKTLTLDLMKVS